jgi:hypothetical protein
MYRAGHDAKHAGNRRRRLADCHDTRGRANHVDDVAQANARADRVPVGIKRGHRGGNAFPEAQLAGPLSAQMARDLIRPTVHAAQLVANSGQRRIE